MSCFFSHPRSSECILTDKGGQPYFVVAKGKINGSNLRFNNIARYIVVHQDSRIPYKCEIRL